MLLACHRAPAIADLGEEGKDSWLDLELKLVADVGVIGVPNAGKSTLLSVITAGQPSCHSTVCVLPSVTSAAKPISTFY